MYNIINIGVHVIAFACFIYAFSQDRFTGKDLRVMFALIGGILILTWGFFVGELYNLRSILNVFGDHA